MACNPASFVRAESGGLLEGSDVETDARAATTSTAPISLPPNVRSRRPSNRRMAASRRLADCAALPDVIGPYENTERLQLLCLALLKGKRSAPRFAR